MAFSSVQFGPGDMQTCGPCEGHPSDPRTDDEPPNGTTAIVIAGERPDLLVAMVDWMDTGVLIDITGVTINGISVPLELFAEETRDAWAEEIADINKADARLLGVPL